jgi:hypothetical protein
MYAAPPKVLETPVKRAIVALRRRQSLGLKKVQKEAEKEAEKEEPEAQAQEEVASPAPTPATPAAVPKMALPTPIRMSINARLAKTPVRAKTPAAAAATNNLPALLLEAIKSRSLRDYAGVAMTPAPTSKSAVDFVSDRLVVESYVRASEAGGRAKRAQQKARAALRPTPKTDARAGRQHLLLRPLRSRLLLRPLRSRLLLRPLRSRLLLRPLR